MDSDSEEWAKDFWSQGVKKGSWREWKMKVETEAEVFWAQHGEVVKKVMSRAVVTAMVWETLLRLGLFSQIGETVWSMIMGAVVVLVSGSAAWFLSEFAVDDDDDQNGIGLLSEIRAHDLKHGHQRRHVGDSTKCLSDISEEDADDEDQSSPERDPESSSPSSSSSEDDEEDEEDAYNQEPHHYEGSDYVYEYESDYSEYVPPPPPPPRRRRSRSYSRRRSRSRGRRRSQGRSQSQNHQDLDFEVEYLSSFSLGDGGPRYGQEGGEGYISSWSGRGSD